MSKLTWFELFDILDGSGLVVTDWDIVNDTLDNFETDLDKPVKEIEILF